jgi:hypothetical protein
MVNSCHSVFELAVLSRTAGGGSEEISKKSI